MTSSTLAQLQTFTDTILLPTFIKIQQNLTTSTKKIIITDNANTGLYSMDYMLYQMHFGKTYLSSLNPSSKPNISNTTAPNWIGLSLYIEILQNSNPDPISTGKYCLSIEFSITPSAHIYLTSIVGYTQAGDRTLQIETRPFENHSGQLDIQNIHSDDILAHFTESFEACERRILEYENTLVQSSRTETIEPVKDLHSSPANLIQPPTPVKPEPPPSETESIPALTPQQQARRLSEQLSPRGFPISSTLDEDLAIPFHIKTLQNRYGQNTDLILKYSPAISESDLLEQLSRLGHYESLRHLERQHFFLQEKMQAWIKQNKQPSPGAIAPHLQQSILQLRNTLYQRITILLDHQLKNLTAAELKAEFDTFNAQHQQQQAIFKQIDQNAVLGYLDISLLDQDEIKQPHALFTSPNQAIDITAKHLKNREGKIFLTLIASCNSEKYQTYLKRKQKSDEQNLFVGYSITQKLYPNRSIFIGEAPKAVFPSLECLWGHADEPTMQPNPLTQIWRLYPMIRTDSAQWIVIAGTTADQPLKTIALENGKMAQEGTFEYLGRSIELMAQSEDEYTHALAGLVSEAVENKRVKYLHVHQTLAPKTGEPRDVIQMRFQMLRS